MLDAERVQLVDALLGLLGQLLELRLRGVQVARRVAAAVAADRGDERALRLDQLAHAGARRDEPLGDGTHKAEGAVSLGRGEDAFRHGAAVS